MKIPMLTGIQQSGFVANIFKQGFLRNVVVLGSGTALAQLLAFLIMPVVTRLYGPSELGVLQIFLLALMLMMPFSHLGYHAAIPLQTSKIRVINLLGLSLGIVVFFGFLSGLVLFFYGAPLFEALDAPEIGGYWYLFVIALVAGGVYEILTSLAVREYRFGDIAKARINQSIVYAAGRVGLGFMAMGAFGLILSVVAGQFAGIYRFLKIIGSEYRSELGSLNRKLMITLAGRYRKFALFNTPSSIIGVFSHWFPTAYVAWQFGSETTGHVSLAFFILVAPMALVGGSVEKGFYAEICKLGKSRGKEINVLMMKIVKYMLLLMVVPIAVTMLWGEQLFSLVFGQQWSVSGEYASIICIMVLFYLCTTPMVTGLVNFIEQQELQLYFDSLNLVLVLLLAWVSISVDASVKQFLLYYALISITIYAVQFVVVFYRYRKLV
ncbi:MAG: oligosaccharide flippase family protein [Halomonas sp.]|nr:oligosaccharide flippase family protein [Halomonas sp.]MCC5881590.1 oligosaccharide flippase family protein [Halomonas sp.]